MFSQSLMKRVDSLKVCCVDLQRKIFLSSLSNFIPSLVFIGFDNFPAFTINASLF